MSLLDHYEKFQSVVPPAQLNNRAWEFFQARGLPTRKDEDFRYTSLKFLTEKDYTPATLQQAQTIPADVAAIEKHFSSEFTNLVFLNGIFQANLSQALPAGAKLVLIPNDKLDFVDSLEALNALYAPQIYEIQVQKEVQVAKPIHLIFWSQGSAALVTSAVKMDVGSRAKVEFLTSYLGTDEDHITLTNIELSVRESAQVSLIKVQEEALSVKHLGLSRIKVAKGAQFENLLFSTGAELSRHALEVLMQGEGATAQVHGVYAVGGQQHVDNNTLIDHIVGHCDTQQLYKGLLDDESRAVFNGKVFIRRDAQKANSSQLNNNLLLSKKAEADSKPLLQIDADDVKASHGATVGQLNKEELFYLLSRAIPKKKAITMLSYGFLSEVIYKVTNEKTQGWLKTKLDRAFSRLSTEHL